MAPVGAARMLPTLSILAILLPALFPAASASCSPPVAGPFPTPSASSTSLAATTTTNDDASASPSPLVVCGCASSPRTRTPSAEAAAPGPVVHGPYRDVASSPPPPPVVDEPFRDATSPPPASPVVDEPFRDVTSPPLASPVADEPYRDATSPSPPPPVVGEPYRDATSPPPPPPVVGEPYRDAASPPPPPPVVGEPHCDVARTPPPDVDEDAARVVSSRTGDDLGKVLASASLGYNEMASLATLLADSAPVAVVTWRGAITVFLGAANGCVFLQHEHSCPKCSLRHLLLDHMTMGYLPYAELAAAPATVFALDDDHGYVSAVRFHIVPGHRLTRLDLLLLRPGTVQLLPTQEGEDDQKLVVTLGDGSACTNEVRVIIYFPFPGLHLANLAASVAVASDIASPAGNATVGSWTVHQRAGSEHSVWPLCLGVPGSATATATATPGSPSPPTSTSSSLSPGRMILILSVVAAILAAAGGLAVGGGGGSETEGCQLCYDNPTFLLKCCNKGVCNFCLRDFVRGKHGETCNGLAAGMILPLIHPHEFGKGADVPNTYAHLPQYPPWYFVKSVKKNSRIHLFYYHLEELEGGLDPRVTEVIHIVNPRGVLADPIQCDVRPTIRPYSEL